MSFHVGQKVVCVDDRLPSDKGPWRVVLNAVYTIREFDDEDPLSPIGVVLEEVRCGIPDGWKKEGGWRMNRFRPLIERSTDTGMAILRKVADDASKKRELALTDREGKS